MTKTAEFQLYKSSLYQQHKTKKRKKMTVTAKENARQKKEGRRRGGGRSVSVRDVLGSIVSKNL